MMQSLETFVAHIIKTSFLSSIVVATSLASTPVAAASTCPSEAFVTSAASAFANAARRGSPQAMAVAAGRYANLRGVAMFALGPYRNNLSPAQERRYVQLAKSFMGRFMVDNAGSLSGRLTITSCSPNSVSGHMDNGTAVSFRLAGGSRIEDVSVSGVSIASAMRSKFSGVISSHGGDVGALMDYLQQ